MVNVFDKEIQRRKSRKVGKSRLKVTLLEGSSLWMCGGGWGLE